MCINRSLDAAREHVLAAITKLASTLPVEGVDHGTHIEVLLDVLSALASIRSERDSGAEDVLQEPESEWLPVVRGTVLASRDVLLTAADSDPIGSVFMPVLLPHDSVDRR